jgi:hypothetical protein
MGPSGYNQEKAVDFSPNPWPDRLFLARDLEAFCKSIGGTKKSPAAFASQ